MKQGSKLPPSEQRLSALVKKNRSYRRFDENSTIDRETLEELVDLARLSASASNLQPLRYILACDPGTNTRIFPLLSWAGFLTGWKGPVEGERPAAYIIILSVKQLEGAWVKTDLGIAAENILLGAVERGLGGCIIASIQRRQLRSLLQIPTTYHIQLVIALGKPQEKVILETVGSRGDTRYWRGRDGTHHVPKHSLEKIILTTG